MAGASRHTVMWVGGGPERAYRFVGRIIRQRSSEENNMAVADRIRSLRDKHALLEQEITREAARSLPDASRITEWKRAKLRIKDTIIDLERTA
jgi:hypothetical protein